MAGYRLFALIDTFILLDELQKPLKSSARRFAALATEGTQELLSGLKFAIKREQSQARLCFVERERTRLCQGHTL